MHKARLAVRGGRWGPCHGYGIVQLIRSQSNNVLQVGAVDRSHRRSHDGAGRGGGM